MTFISYAQNGEDVVLARALGTEPAGFYLDIGASDPTVDSVTRHFYDHGWSGINVEPASLVVGDLRESRPRDVTLELAMGGKAGRRTFYELAREHTGNSTFSAEIAANVAADGEEIAQREIEVTTLEELWMSHVQDRTVDFLKIDVEGAEAEVLRGADFARHRPRVLVIEATRPGTADASHADWEPGLLEAGYALTLFDGLNRFYARVEDASLIPALSVPANVHDDYIPFRYGRWRADLDAMEADLAGALTDLVAARTEAETWAQRATARATALSLTRQELARSQAALHDALAELRATRQAVRNDLAGRAETG